MRSRKVEFRLPWPWYEWIEKRAASMKPRPYKDVPAYFKGLSFHDAMVQRPHVLTIDFANASIDEQDRVIDELIRVSPSGPISGSWLEHRLADAISEVAKRHGVTLTAVEITEMLVQKIREYVLNPELPLPTKRDALK